MSYRPKEYFDNGRNLEWKEKFSTFDLIAMEQEEIFTLLNEERELFSKVSMDFCNQIKNA